MCHIARTMDTFDNKPIVSWFNRLRIQITYGSVLNRRFFSKILDKLNNVCMFFWVFFLPAVDYYCVSSCSR